MSDLQRTIGGVVMGKGSTVVWVRWIDLDGGGGFPEVAREDRHEWPGQLHQKEIMRLVAELPEPADHSHAEVIGGRR